MAPAVSGNHRSRRRHATGPKIVASTAAKSSPRKGDWRWMDRVSTARRSAAPATLREVRTPIAASTSERASAAPPPIEPPTDKDDTRAWASQRPSSARWPRAEGTIKPLDQGTCAAHLGADSPGTIALVLGRVDFDFTIDTLPSCAASTPARRRVTDRTARRRPDWIGTRQRRTRASTRQSWRK